MGIEVHDNDTDGPGVHFRPVELEEREPFFLLEAPARVDKLIECLFDSFNMLVGNGGIEFERRFIFENGIKSFVEGYIVEEAANDGYFGRFCDDFGIEICVKGGDTIGCEFMRFPCDSEINESGFPWRFHKDIGTMNVVVDNTFHEEKCASFQEVLYKANIVEGSGAHGYEGERFSAEGHDELCEFCKVFVGDRFTRGDVWIGLFGSGGGSTGVGNEDKVVGGRGKFRKFFGDTNFEGGIFGCGYFSHRGARESNHL